MSNVESHLVGWHVQAFFHGLPPKANTINPNLTSLLQWPPGISWWLSGAISLVISWGTTSSRRICHSLEAQIEYHGD
ncbi:hypothetical protein PENSUB_3229 [Penicillium subrubescens]|jgi:hypothetical protein|uniref:Uncharacterized protein n=1 Tax=Penicillium subrubescens TaxID=1316194 RepID=A0A1Q5UFG1_9EURO|nr:hypothetical protein PENSUB_3229 [Penicillium subrubescens]